MKPVAFEYVRPDGLDETLAVLAEEGSDAAVLAGGMSLGPMLNLRLVRPSVVVDVGRIVEIQGIEVADGHVVTGAGVRQAQAMTEPSIGRDVPLLAQALPWIGHYQTRSRGTLGGSVAHADPSAEVPLSLVALGGEIELRSARRRRTVKARDFFLGVLTTNRLPEEVVTALRWPMRREGEGFGFAEIAERRGDFAIGAVAVRVRVNADQLDEISVAVGGIEDRPLAMDTSDFHGADASPKIAEAIAEHVTFRVQPVSDRAASAAHRRALTRDLTHRTVVQAIQDAKGERS